MNILTTTAQQTLDRDDVALLGRETGEQFSLRVQEQPPGAGTPLHQHVAQSETFHVVSGTFKFQAGDEVIIGQTGDTVFIPKNTPHRFMNVGEDNGRLISILTPGINDGFIETIPKAQRDGVSMEQLSEMAQEFGTEILGPKFSE